MNEHASQTVPPRLIEFFKREAVQYLDVLERTLGRDDPAALAEFLAAARALRGSATMSRFTALAVLASRIEKLARSISAGRMRWNVPLMDMLREALNDVRRLVAAAGNWSREEEDLAHRRTSELTLQGTPIRGVAIFDVILPVARLFYDDAGPHVMYVAVNPQTQFEQQLSELSGRQTPQGITTTQEFAIDPRTDRRTPSAAARALAWRPPETAGTASVPPPARAQSPTPPPARTTAPEAPPLPPPAPPEPARTREEQRTGSAPRGSELRTLLEISVSRLTASFSGRGDELLPIDALVYRGPAALARAQRISAMLRARGGPAAPDDFAELLDLIELAGRD